MALRWMASLIRARLSYPPRVTPGRAPAEAAAKRCWTRAPRLILPVLNGYITTVAHEETGIRCGCSVSHVSPSQVWKKPSWNCATCGVLAGQIGVLATPLAEQHIWTLMGRSALGPLEGRLGFSQNKSHFRKIGPVVNLRTNQAGHYVLDVADFCRRVWQA